MPSGVGAKNLELDCDDIDLLDYVWFERNYKKEREKVKRRKERGNWFFF